MMYYLEEIYLRVIYSHEINDRRTALYELICAVIDEIESDSPFVGPWVEALINPPTDPVAADQQERDDE